MTLAATLLAYEPSQVKPGYIALLIVLALALATFFLVRSMLKRIKKINFDENPDSTAQSQQSQQQAETGDTEREDP